MSKLDAQIEDRMIELLADRAVGTLSREDAAELKRLLGKYPHLDSDVLDVAAASLDLAFAKRPFEPMPAHVANRALAAVAAQLEKTTVDMPPAVAELRARREAPPQAAPDARGRLFWTGWLAAAACVLFMVGFYRVTHAPAAPLANERAKLMAAVGTTEAVFAATKDPAAVQATGDVVWSPSEQRGYMRLRGLAANDAARWQYQLWIFDEQQDERFPIDGGVFDVDPAQASAQAGDVLVPIRAKIKVSKATAFVVTVEKPGGVVVSKRERVVMAAKI